jgi:uncharacterized protein (DUF736 family)|tara:strand:+ start:207 stop:497 length:291 start_codon:yes stop_codon:yes gene_type:complete
MAFEQKDNSGALFHNDKDGNTARPDFTGTCMVNGQMMSISAWNNQVQSTGKPYLGIKFSEPFVKSETGQSIQPPVAGSNYKQPVTPEDDLDDNIPF